MSYDVYVGSFTRYILGDWENVAQRSAREQGIEYKLIRDNETEEAPPPPDEVARSVREWRDNINAGLAPHLRSPLDWDESADAPYATDRPGWHGYAALMLLAAYADRPDLRLPSRLPEEWGDDPVYKAASEEEVETKYPAILLADLWFPGAFEFMFGVEDLGGNPRSVASTSALRDELRALNTATFRGSEDDVEAWAKSNPPPDAPLDDLAKFGLALWIGLVSEAIRRELPMMTDY